MRFVSSAGSNRAAMARLGAVALVLAVAGTAPAYAATLPMCPVTDGMTASYDIVRGGSVIGRHTVQFAKRGADLVVTIGVTAALYALGVRVYHYEHHGTELWRDGRMLQMDTRTVDDGDQHTVNARMDPASGIWTGLPAKVPVTGPLLASSLWNSETVRQTRFLDNETGAVNPLRVTPAGEEALTLAGKQVRASRFEMAGNTAGSVWYDGSGCWVRALFKSPLDGSMIDVRAR